MPYEKNNGKYREQHNAYMREYMRKKREEDPHYCRGKSSSLRDWVHTLKESTPCTDCKMMYPYYVMDFDHLPEFEKSGQISTMISQGATKKVKEEIAKCEIVCANCHRQRTHDRLEE
jgi:hypothetical protein